MAGAREYSADARGVTVEKPGHKPGPKVPQKHGGAIYQGTPKNIVPGPGRPPSEIRRTLRASFDQRVKILEEIADSEQASPADRMKAVDLLAKYGLGTTKELTVEHVQDRLRQTIDVIQRVLSPEQADALLAELEPIWS